MIPQYTIEPSLLTPLEKQALYRDYAVLVSAYLLEGKTKAGRARVLVPANIAVPFAALADDLEQKSIMSYDSECSWGALAHVPREPRSTQHAHHLARTRAAPCRHPLLQATASPTSTR